MTFDGAEEQCVWGVRATCDDESATDLRGVDLSDVGEVVSGE